MPSSLRIGDVGTPFKITVYDVDGVVNLSSCTSKKIYLEKPSGETLEKTASFLTDGSDGIIQYLTIQGDIDEVGTWQIQAKIEFSNSKFSTDIQKFKVLRNLT
jgi:hypothetical protein